MPRDTARELIGRIRKELSELDSRIRSHKYIQGLEQGRVSSESLKEFAGHQFHIIGSDLRSVALLLNRHGSLPSRRFINDILQGESDAFEACLGFAAALGLSRAQLEAFEPAPDGVAYAWYVNWLASYGSDAELAAAFLVNFAAWGHNCGRMQKALESRYGMKKPDLTFFALFAETPSGFEDAALTVIEAGLKRGVEPRLIGRAARLLQGCELLFWDSLAAP